MSEQRATPQKASVHEDWPGVLDAYGVQFLVLDTSSDGELLKIFKAQPGWRIYDQDEATVIFARSEVA